MSSLADFIKNFLNSKGHYVFLSLLVAKICGFIGSALIFRLLDKHEMGAASIVMSLSVIFIAFSGFGSQQGLLRYGSITDNQDDKNALSAYLFKKGLFYHIILSLIFLFSSVFYVEKYEHILYFFIFFSIRLVGYYFYNYTQSQLRINGDNQGFARLNNVVNIVGLALMLAFTYLWGLTGYLTSLMLIPYISLLWLKPLKIKAPKIIFDKKELWTYNFQTAATALFSDALFSIDVLILGFLMSETAVANYKAAILLPANVTFLAVSFMQSDFPTLAKNYQNKKFLTNYIKNYYKIFIPICILIFGISFLLKDELVKLASGNRYDNLGISFSILLGAFLLNMLFRNLYGNLLSAVGLMKVNTIVSILVLLVLSGLSLFLVPKYGINGMAIAQAISLQFTGVVLMFSFIIYLRKL
ncbi:oligosaccharide flippase family protein [Soonwooa sp.]|uniref:oligosaccharide flippase family protein n=1 Tax=Soonwooa sp. TaxID=1938592 RepID=UPI00260B5C5C|nr:oligosaccharide flippase family protein [Soonwooa sp.]